MPRTKYLLTRSANPSVTVANNAAGCGGIAASAEQPLRLGPRRRARGVQPRAVAEPDDHVPGDRRQDLRRRRLRLGRDARARRRAVSYAAVGHLHGRRRERPHHRRGIVHRHRLAGGSRRVRHRGERAVPYYPAATSRGPSRSRRRARRSTSRRLPDKTFGVDDGDFAVSATASSGLPVSFAAAGPCSVSGVTVHITDVGDCTITASQAGNENYNAAPSVSRRSGRRGSSRASSSRSTTAWSTLPRPAAPFR